MRIRVENGRRTFRMTMTRPRTREAAEAQCARFTREVPTIGTGGTYSVARGRWPWSWRVEKRWSVDA